MTAVGVTEVGVTAVINYHKLLTIINIGSTIILWWSLIQVFQVKFCLAEGLKPDMVNHLTETPLHKVGSWTELLQYIIWCHLSQWWWRTVFLKHIVSRCPLSTAVGWASWLAGSCWTRWTNKDCLAHLYIHSQYSVYSWIHTHFCT